MAGSKQSTLGEAAKVTPDRAHVEPSPRGRWSFQDLKDLSPKLQRLFRSESVRLVAPVAVVGVATPLLLLSVDYTQRQMILSASLSVALLCAVVIRQVAKIVDLERQIDTRAQQLSVVSEVVSALNASPNVGTTLGPALQHIIAALGADAGAIWLPSPALEGRLMLVEQFGLPDPDKEGDLLEAVRAAVPGNSAAPAPVPHSTALPGRGSPAAVRCLSVKMGRRAEDFGYLTVMKWHGGFGEPEGAVLAAIGSDIGGALRSMRMINEARNLADRDPLTELYNHRYIHQRLYSEAERSARTERPLSILMLDLDNFKMFNDTYGHPSGDEVLKRVANLMRRCFRDSDVVGRYGGDEFMVVLPETNLEQALRAAERLRSMLAKERFSEDGSASLPIQFSCGVAAFPEDSREVLELVAIADGNLYQSKAQGDGQITARTLKDVDHTSLHVEGFDLLRSMIIAIDNKDRYTRRHSEEVTEYSLQLARAMKLGGEMLQTIHISGLLHDVGKIGVPDRVLRKPGKLNDEEFKVMKQHPVVGALIVGAMPGMEDVVLGVRHHHERYDGRGYPDALAGEEIPLIGRIMAVGDAFSAMTTSRPYRKGLSEEEALAQIQAGLGTQFDPEIGALFIRLRTASAAGKAAGAPTS